MLLLWWDPFSVYASSKIKVHAKNAVQPGQPEPQLLSEVLWIFLSSNHSHPYLTGFSPAVSIFRGWFLFLYPMTGTIIFKIHKHPSHKILIQAVAVTWSCVSCSREHKFFFLRSNLPDLAMRQDRNSTTGISEGRPIPSKMNSFLVFIFYLVKLNYRQ